jgi:hypothetical protein
MAADSPEPRFDVDITICNPSIFALLLTKHFKTLLEPFTVSNPLTEVDFGEGNDNTFLGDIKSLSEYFKQGYTEAKDRDPTYIITCSQFLCRATQVLMAI